MSFLKIQPGESKKIIFFATVGLLLNGGMTLGISAMDALFLSELGPENLPYIYIFLPLVMIGFTPLSSYLQSRYKIESVISGVVGVIAFGAILLGVCIQVFEGHPLYSIFLYSGKLFSVIWFIGLYTIFWNYVDAYFSIIEGKRLYGLINAGSCLGIILFGLLLFFLSDKIPTSSFLYIWALTCLIAWPLVSTTHKLFPNLEDTVCPVPNKAKEENILKTTFQTILRSRFALFTGLLYFLLPLLTYTNEYLCFSVFSQHGGQQEITALFGKLYTIANLLNLFISLFLFNYLAAYMGVRNIVLIQPIVYFFVFLWYYNDLTFASAIFGFFAYQTILPSIDSNNANLLFNALPTSQKRAIRTFIEGLGEPVSIALTGILLLCVVKYDLSHWVTLSAIAGTAIIAIIAYAINQLYVDGILQNLKENWFDIESLKNKGKSKIQSDSVSRLVQKLEQTDDPRIQLHIIEILLKLVPPDQAVDLIKTLFSFHSDYKDSVIKIVENYLENSSGINGVKKTINKLPDEHWVWSSDFLIPYGLHSEGKTCSLNNEDPHSELVIRKNLAQIIRDGQEDGISYIISCLRSKHSRLIALKTLDKSVDAGMYQIASEITKHITLFNDEEFQCYLNILRKIKYAKSITYLLSRRGNYSKSERRTIRKIILEIGKRSVPALLKVIHDSQLPLSNRSLALNTLAQLSYPQIRSIWRELLDQEIENLTTYHNMACSIHSESSGYGFTSLKESYTDQRNQTLEWILNILSIAGKIPDHLPLLDSLNSENPKEKANGVEVIIEGVGIRFFKRIELYLNCYLDPDVQQAIQNRSDTSPQEILNNALNSQQELLVLAACHAALSEEWGCKDTSVWDALENQDDPFLLANAIKDYFTSRNHHKTSDDKIIIPKLELVHLLHQSRLFSCIKLTDLIHVIPYLKILEAEKISQIEDHIYYIACKSSGGENYIPSENNMEQLFGILKSEHSPHQSKKPEEQSAILITFTKESILRIIQAFPEFGLHLIKQKSIQQLNA